MGFALRLDCPAVSSEPYQPLFGQDGLTEPRMEVGGRDCGVNTHRLSLCKGKNIPGGISIRLSGNLMESRREVAKVGSWDHPTASKATVSASPALRILGKRGEAAPASLIPLGGEARNYGLDKDILARAGEVLKIELPKSLQEKTNE